jgi:MarR family transcriptional regulator, negative regulator of the multidrug operon emrRAB
VHNAHNIYVYDAPVKHKIRKSDPMAKKRTANLLGALVGAITEQLDLRKKSHANETDTSLAALNILSAFEGCSNAMLSRALKLSHPATVRLVDRLEASAWVEARAGNDKRSVALYVTESGRARANQAVHQRGLTLSEIVSQLSGVQRKNLDDISETLLRALTTNEAEAVFTCRLCDDNACPPERCPVHQTAISRENVSNQ